MINKEVYRALLKKLGTDRQGLSKRVQRVKKECLITTDEAQYVLAHQAGIRLDRHLDPDAVAQIRTLMLQITGTAPRTEPQGNTKATRSAGSRTILLSKDFDESDPILPDSILQDARRMAEIYPLLYVLENSIRELISRVMESAFGTNWWDTNAPRGLRDATTNRMKDEERNAWHQKRGAHPIYYLDLNQLPALVRQNESVFAPKFLPSGQWIQSLIEDVYPSRCVVSHMNPLVTHNVRRIKLRLGDWQQQVRAKLDLLD